MRVREITVSSSHTVPGPQPYSSVKCMNSITVEIGDEDQTKAGVSRAFEVARIRVENMCDEHKKLQLTKLELEAIK